MSGKISNFIAATKAFLVKYRVAILTALPVVLAVSLVNYLAYYMPETRIEGMIYAPRTCEQADPVYVGFVNHSARTIRFIRFRIEATKADNGQNTVRHDPYTLEKTIKPGEGTGSCYDLHLLTDYSIEDIQRFKYQLDVDRISFSDY